MEAGTVLEPSAAARAAQEVGIRAVIGDSRVVDPSSGGKTIRRSPRTFDEAVQRLGSQVFRNADPEALVTGHVTVHGLGTSSARLLVEAKRRADEAGVVLNTHLAYSAGDLAADRARYGADPLVYLSHIGVLDNNLTLGHANLLTDAECDALIASGASVVWAPAAAAMWGHRGSLHGRHAELWRRGANVCFGSDSGNWSNDFDLFRQANLALLSARAFHASRTALTAEDVLDMATRAAARATGLAERTGSIERGKRADLVIHTFQRPELWPPTSMLRNLMYAAHSKTVDTVIVDGKVVLEHGQFVALDEPRLLARIGAASAALLARLGYTVEPAWHTSAS
jgi:cytosine/adenosine deaminase-related metal-dependent hydrolase